MFAVIVDMVDHIEVLCSNTSLLFHIFTHCIEETRKQTMKKTDQPTGHLSLRYLLRHLF